MADKPICVLAILDGWGIGKRGPSNAIHVAQPPTIEYIKNHYPAGALQASGISVGLPWNEVGNSEVGHLTIGAGKVIYQHYPRITLSIQGGEFFKNPVFLQAFAHVKENKSALNIAGLLTEGNIHASFEHLEALIQMAKENGITELNLHLFADGKDSRPRSAIALVARLNGVIEKYGVGRLASFTGRYYALDREGQWNRTEQAYKVMTGMTEPTGEKLEEVINRSYDKNENDDFIEATAVGPQAHPIAENDALIFIDYREDSIRQIAGAFIVPGFDQFPVKTYKNLFVATMTAYSKLFNVPVAFPNEDISFPIGKVLSDAGKTQLLIAETEKYAHVTYFFNGYRDELFPNQFKVLVPSQNVPRHDDHPEMMAEEIGNRVVQAVEEKSFDFIVVNFANADIIAHTGNLEAAVKGILVIDKQIERIVKACAGAGAHLVITSDHGNAEQMADPFTGAVETSHDPSQVPIYIVGPGMERVKTSAQVAQSEQEIIGILSDVAPTVLELLGVAKPKEMRGRSLTHDLL